MLLSFIIPVYNTGAYLEECINSCLKQNVKEYEIILVNDGSSDSKTLEILDRFSSCDSIKVLNKDNTGVSSSRNKGLSIARGDYVLFVDSDDIVGSNIVCELKKLLKKNNPQIILGMTEKFKNSSKLTIKKRYNRENTIINNINDIFEENFFIGSAWNYILERKFLLDNAIVFNSDKKYTEDIDFILNAIVKATNFDLLNETHYFYRNNNNSATSKISIDRVENTFDTIKIWVQKNKKLKSKWLEDFMAYQFYIVLGMAEIIKYKNDEFKNYLFLLKMKETKKTKICYYCNLFFGNTITIKLCSLWIKRGLGG